MSGKAYLSNVVDRETMRKIQKVVLQDLSDYLQNSFGPKGSNTCIKKLNTLNMYTKDGFTILKSLAFNGIVEQSIKDDIETITQHVATTVGDGTTSAVLLSNLIFNGLLEFMDQHPEVSPSDILYSLNECADKVIERIKEDSKEATIDSIREIAYVSSNGNDWITDTITNLYKEMGMGVFIDVSPSLNKETSIKYFDGMTINTGYSDSVFITDSRNNTCVVDKPEIYFFEDPIDNKEMGVFLNSIVSHNILNYFDNSDGNARFNQMSGKKRIIPTVIVAPHVSRDMASTIDTIVDYQSKLPTNNKIPFLMITDTHQVDEIQDLSRLCGAKSIHKYIDSEIYKKDVEAGLAPTPESIFNWAGSCEQVVAHSTRTKFINPSKMKNEDGSLSNEYTNLLSYIENEISKLQNDGDSKTIGLLKRRLHSLQSNLVEISVGGITVADRDSNRHLFEDAVLNCRSAAKNGVGWGANVSGLLAIDCIDKFYSMKSINGCLTKEENIDYNIISILYTSYRDLLKLLYNSSMSGKDAEKCINDTFEKRQPMNLRTMEFDGAVKSSIESDCIILKSVIKIIGIMVTCNQFVVPTPQHNVYTNLKEIK